MLETYSIQAKDLAYNNGVIMSGRGIANTRAIVVVKGAIMSIGDDGTAKDWSNAEGDSPENRSELHFSLEDWWKRPDLRI